MGGGTTAIINFLEGSPIYSSVLPIGAKHITNDLAIGLRARLEDAEKIKLKLSNERPDFASTGINKVPRQEDFDVSEFGLEMEAVPRRLLYEIIDARLNEVFSLIALEIKKANLSGKLPAGVVLTGGGAMTSGIERVAKNVLKMPVRVGMPKGVTGLIDEIQGPAFSATVGAILYGLNFVKAGGVLPFDKNQGKITLRISKLFEKIRSFLP